MIGAAHLKLLRRVRAVLREEIRLILVCNCVAGPHGRPVPSTMDRAARRDYERLVRLRSDIDRALLAARGQNEREI